MWIVEVRSARAKFPQTLGEMREWLDRNNHPLIRFETETDKSGIMIRVQFDADDVAEQFRHSFQGSYDDGSAVPMPVRTDAAQISANLSDWAPLGAARTGTRLWPK